MRPTNEPQLFVKTNYTMLVSVEIREVHPDSDTVREEFSRFALAGSTIRRDLNFAVAQKLMQTVLDCVRAPRKKGGRK